MYIKCTKVAAHRSAHYENDRLLDDTLEYVVKTEYRHQMLHWPFPVVCWLRVWVVQRKYFV